MPPTPSLADLDVGPDPWPVECPACAATIVLQRADLETPLLCPTCRLMNYFRLRPAAGYTSMEAVCLDLLPWRAPSTAAPPGQAAEWSIPFSVHGRNRPGSAAVPTVK